MSRARMSVEAALALGLVDLEQPLVGDVYALLAGRLHGWSRWSGLPDNRRLLWLRLLRQRPVLLVQQHRFEELVEELLCEGVRFRFDEPVLDGPLSTRYAPSIHMDPEVMAKDLMAELERRAPARIAVPKAKDGWIQLEGPQVAFAVPAEAARAAPRAAKAPESTGRDVDLPSLDRDRLLALAGRLDELHTSAPYRHEVLSTLLAEVRTASGEPLRDPLYLPQGPTRLIVAPTGRGKSVLSHMAALDWASRGYRVALVVPGVSETLQVASTLQRDARALAFPLRVAPVNSPATLYERTSDVLAHPPPYDPDGMWTLSTLGYTCRLAAWALEGAIGPGCEPCRRLFQRKGRTRVRVACPFQASCGKFRTHREALDADILVVNHAAFLRGRLQAQVEGEAEPPTLLEVVLREADVIFVDEVDRLQTSLIETYSGSLAVSSLHRASMLQRLLTEFEEMRAAGALEKMGRLDHVRTQLHLVTWLAEELADQLNRGDVCWGQRRTLRGPASDDGQLAACLFGKIPEACDLLETLFHDEEPANRHHVALWQAIRAWRTRSLEDERDTGALRLSLAAALDAWPWPPSSGQRPVRAKAKGHARTVGRVVPLLVLKVVLERLERAINRLRPQLALLEESGVETARLVREKLSGFESWSPSPLGPLGRRPIGFSFQRAYEDPGELQAHALAGDPHRFVAALGEEIALALVGRRRPVLGMSATGRFAGSPRSDVRARLFLLQPDEPSGVDVLDGRVSADSVDEALSISGVSHQAHRALRTRKLAERLWNVRLRAHLEMLSVTPGYEERARVLLVTGSYTEALVVGDTLLGELGLEAAERDLRVVTRRTQPRADRTRIHSREIEDFGRSGARILVAPLSVVARGYNIMGPSGRLSAIGSIWVLVRPVPPLNSAQRALAHVSYDSIMHPPGPSHHPMEAMRRERVRAEAGLRSFQRSTGPLSTLPAELQRQVLCDVLVDLAQLAGRARRGRCPVQIHLVDGAFHHEEAGWPVLLRQVFHGWREADDLEEMLHIHRAWLTAFARFAGYTLEGCSG